MAAQRIVAHYTAVSMSDQLAPARDTLEMSPSRVPLANVVGTDHAVEMEWIVGNEFFCCAAAAEERHRALWLVLVAERADLEQITARAEFVESGAMSEQRALADAQAVTISGVGSAVDPEGVGARDPHGFDERVTICARTYLKTVGVDS
jgi:hypothetical protein